MAGGTFVVQQTAVGHGQHPGTAIDGEAAAGGIGEAIGLGVAGIGIRAADGAHDRAGAGVLRHGVGGEGEIRGPFVHVGQGDSNGLCIGTTIPIGYLHRHIIDIVTTTIRW